MFIAAALIVVSMAICYYSAPGDAEARGMKEMGVEYQPATQKVGTRQTPGEWLEYSPLLTIVVCTLGFTYLIRRGRGERPVDHPRAEPLCLSVPDRRPAAALAAAFLRPGDCRLGRPGRRRADPVPAVRRDRAHDDRVGHRHPDGALLRGDLDGAYLSGS